jgi:hypothetical protein
MKVLIACEESQAVCKAFRAKGHEAFSCDVQPCSGGHPEWHIRDDVLTILEKQWDLMIAHPVCKYLSNSGVRWLYKKQVLTGNTVKDMDRWRKMREACEFYKKLRDAPIKRKCVENPIIHCHARELIRPGHRQVVQPWWFGEPAFKATGFELIGLPDLIPTNKLTPPEKGTDEHKAWSWVHRMPPGPERAKLRSKTFLGIAGAMAEQWG